MTSKEADDTLTQRVMAVSLIGGLWWGILQIGLNRTGQHEPTSPQSVHAATDIPLELVGYYPDGFKRVARSFSHALVATQYRAYVVSTDRPELYVIGQSQLFTEPIKSMYVGQDVAVLGGQNTSVVIDLSDQTVPVFAAQDVPVGPIQDQLMFSFDGLRQFQITSLSDPYHPKALSNIRSLPEPPIILPFGEQVYLGVAPGLRVLDVGTPSRPTFASTVQLTQTIQLMSASANLLAAVTDGADGRSSLLLFDISDRHHPILVGGTTESKPCASNSTQKCRAWSPQQLLIRNGSLYLLSQFDGLFVFDVHDPIHPHQTDFISLPPGGSMFDLGNFLVVDGDDLVIFDLSQPQFPKAARVIVLNEFDWMGEALRQNNTLFVVSNVGLAIFDITNPAEPSLRGVLEIEGVKNSIVGHLVRLNDLLVIPGSDRTYIVDISTLDVPRLASSITGSGEFVRNASSLYGQMLLPRGDGGLAIYDLSDASAPRLLKLIKFRHRVTAIAVNEPFVYVGGMSTSATRVTRNLSTLELTRDLTASIRSEQFSQEGSQPPLDRSVELLRFEDMLIQYQLSPEFGYIDARVLDISTPSAPRQIGVQGIGAQGPVTAFLGELFWHTSFPCIVSGGGCYRNSKTIKLPDLLSNARLTLEGAQLRGTIFSDANHYVYAAGEGLYIAQMPLPSITPGATPSPYPTPSFPKFRFIIPTEVATVTPSAPATSTSVVTDKMFNLFLPTVSR